MVSKPVLVALVLIGSLAHAEPPAATPPVELPGLPPDRGYAGMGAALLLSRSLALGATGEAAVRIGPTPFLIRGMAASGSLRDPFEPRTYHIVEARLGIEADACSSTRRGCVFAGVDLGYLADRYTPAESDVEVPLEVQRFVVLPRVGLELGGSTLRLRAALEYGEDAAGLQLALLLHFD